MTSIKLTHVQVTQIEFSIKNFNPAIQFKEPGIEIGFLHNDAEELQEFGIVITVDLHDNDTHFKLNVRTVAHFSTEQKVNTKEFIASNMVTINAPAIAFPFVRSFIATLTTTAGYNPIYLPTLNFVELARIKSASDNDSKKNIKKKKAKV